MLTAATISRIMTLAKLGHHKCLRGTKFLLSNNYPRLLARLEQRLFDNWDKLTKNTHLLLFVKVSLGKLLLFGNS